MSLFERYFLTRAGLSVLEVCLLVGVKHRLDLQEEQFNFEMVYDNYREFTQRMSTWGRSVNLFYIKPVAHKVNACIDLTARLLKGC